MESRKTLTTESGAAVTDNQNSRTAGPAGPVLLEDHHLIEKRESAAHMILVGSNSRVDWHNNAAMERI